MSNIMTYNPRINMPNDCTSITLDEVIDAIKKGSLPIHGSTTCETIKDVKLKMDTATDSAIKSKLKDSLPVFVAAGEFSHRSDTKLVKYSEYIVIDLDYETPEEMSERSADWDRLKSFPFVRAMFASPRNGIKVIVRHNSDDSKYHKQLFGQILSVINCDKKDLSGCNISRACYFSYDPDLYENPDCEMFRFSPVEEMVKFTTTAITPSSKPTSSAPIIPPTLNDKEERQAIKQVQSWSDSNFPICLGARHKHLNMFAKCLQKLGVSQQSAVEYLILKYIGLDSEIGDELSGKEIESVVNYAYG